MAVTYLGSKLIISGLLFLITYLSTFAPWFIESRFQSSYITVVVMSYCNCLAGGTILGVLLMHVLPTLFVSSASHGSSLLLIGLFFAGLSLLLLFSIDKFMSIQSTSHIHSDGPSVLSTPDKHDIENLSKEALVVPLNISSILGIILALSVHSFLEGLGLGPINRYPELFSYVVGLFSHKWLEAFALGINVYNARFSIVPTLFINLFYSILTPLGIMHIVCLH